MIVADDVPSVDLDDFLRSISDERDDSTPGLTREQRRRIAADIRASRGDR
jgi:hypothetical protein